MKIELKNIQYSPRLSEETVAFSASLYINDTKAATALNYGHGGPTEFRPLDEEGKKLIMVAEEYCKTLPPQKFAAEGTEHSIKMDLELFIDGLVSQYVNQRELQAFRKKIERAAEKSIVIGIPDQSFSTLNFKSPIDMLLVHPKGKDILTSIINERVMPQLTDGKMILNTNIPEDILKTAGLKEGQYQKLEVKGQLFPKQKNRKNKGKKL